MQIDNVGQAYDSGFVPPPRRLSFSSQVLQELIVGIDSFVILSAALISYAAIVGHEAADPTYYGAAICFVWLVSISLDEPGRPLPVGSGHAAAGICRQVSHRFRDDDTLSACRRIRRQNLRLVFPGLDGELRRWPLALGRFWFAASPAALCATSRITAYSRDASSSSAPENRHERLLTYIEASRPRFISVLGAFSETSADFPAASRHHRLGGIDRLADVCARQPRRRRHRRAALVPRRGDPGHAGDAARASRSTPIWPPT